LACFDGGTDTDGHVVMSDTHPGGFGDPKNIFGNLANDVSDTHRVFRMLAPLCQVLSLGNVYGDHWYRHQLEEMIHEIFD
jgi:hypothetical protein